MALIPIFSLYNNLGLFDTVLGLILFHTAFGLPFAIFLLRNFFIGIPKDLLEAARIDGASEIRIFSRLILPLGLPAIASLAIFQFLWTWNDLLVALTFGRDDAADHGRDLLPAAPVRLEHRADRAGRVHLAGDPAGGLLRLPALLRPGAAGRLGQVGRVTARCAIVGAGLGGFVAYATLRHGGLEPGEIAVFGDRRRTRPAPGGRARRRSGSGAMRSESDGHCYPTLVPRARARARRRGARDLAPLVAERLRPLPADASPSSSRHVDELRERSGWDESFRRARDRARAARSTAASSSTAHGVFRHVLLAPGHPGLALPAELERRPARRPRLRAARRTPSRVAVVGAGMAAATEWLNALAAGAEVVSVRRREPARRPLNVAAAALLEARPRRLPRDAAGASAPSCCARFGAPSYPPGRELGRAARARGARGPLPRRSRSSNGAEQVICATGFRRGFEHDPLLRRLVDEHGLETEGRWIVLAPDSTVPALTDATRTLALAGVPAQWAYPAADTLVGMKYAARRFLRGSRRCRTR